MQFTLSVPDIHSDHFPEIPQTNWSLISATPAQFGYDGTKAFDGNLNTYYHVPWGNTNPRPHEIVIDLAKLYDINECYYTANKNNSPPWEGRIQEYEIYISTDGINWGTAVASGTFFQTGIRQYVLFPGKTGRYLKFSAVDAFNGDVRTSIAEINLRGIDASQVSVSEIGVGKHFRIFPNPVHDLLNIEIPESRESTVTVFNTSGQILSNTVIYESTALNVSDLPTGIYFVRIVTPDKIETAEFIKS